MKNFYIICLALALPYLSLAQSEPTTCQKTKQLVLLLDKQHFQPRDLDDTFSEEVFEEIIDRIDPQGIYFTEEVLDSLGQFRVGLDDELKSGKCDFIPQLSQKFQARLSILESLIDDLSQLKLDFSKADTISIFGPDRFSFAKDEKTLKNRWKRWFKYHALLQMRDLIQIEDTPVSSISDSLEKAIRKQVHQKAVCKIQQTFNPQEGIENYMYHQFLNVIAESYDPHTAFFSQNDKERFETALSTEAGSFGLELDENPNGEIEIKRLTPGGAAWRSNQLHKGDILIEIQLNNQDSPDLNCIDARDLMKMLNQPGNNKMSVKVKKSDGKTETVVLYKEKLESDENLIKGFVLNGERKIGYISLPGFYTEWEQESGQGCADDVAREIIKLKREGIEGLILDLRYNGGGSMSEALDLAGIFVEDGPISLYKDRDSEAGLLKDKNRGTIFDEPLVIMINKFSASASEILAAALQDYNRALIVGGKSYGKASGQIILPLDINFNLSSSNSQSKDFVKVTVTRFYRLDGSSHQLTGVIPDIILPDMISRDSYGENTLRAHLPADSVVKKVYYSPANKMPITELAEQYALRNAKDNRFWEIEELNNTLAETFQNGIDLPLNLSIFQGDFKKILDLSDQADELSTRENKIFTVKNHQFDQDILQFSEFKKEMNDYLKTGIQEDLYVQETYQIISDLINLNNK